MILESLWLSDFRNFHQVQVSLPPGLCFFVGENGQGKTNLIEAVHLLSRGVSFRPSQSTSLIRTGARHAQILAKLNKHELDYKIGFAIQDGKKSANINGRSATSAQLMQTFPTVLFSPESLSAIKDGPEQRRVVIDEVLLNTEPKKGQLLREHSRALKSRNRLLKNIAHEIGPRREQVLALESLDKIYFLLCTHLTFDRIQALQKIMPFFRDATEQILGAGRLAIDYVISGESALEWSDSEIFNALSKRHFELASREMATGASLVGPHKHDIRFLFNGNDSRFYCSQGQQRALILALKIAEIVYHHQVHQTYPVLLLDDVLSELDSNKRMNLMKFLEGVSAQVLITSTDLVWPEKLAENFSKHDPKLARNSIFKVVDGKVTLLTENEQRELDRVE